MLPHKLPAGGTQLTISSTSVGLADAIAAASGADFSLPEGANRVLVQCETNDLRYLLDETDPTSSIGIICTAGNNFTIDGDIGKLRMIRDAAADVTLNIQILTVYPGEH